MGAGHLLLFDIDGTLLLRAAAAHKDALHDALCEVHGLGPDQIGQVPTAGRTDLEIARHLLLEAGVPADHIDARNGLVREAAIAAYARLCPADLTDTVAPGMRELVSGLAERDDVHLALVTGNLEPIARLKLSRAGLGPFFPPGQGGFGSDDEDRTQLPAVARERATRNGLPFPRERTIVIGDTPLDILCARADGVRCVAVTTGPHSAADLAAADAVAGDAKGVGDALRALGV
ncbi:MAG: haloacid dehalogenase-like hydrolase [Solirubrobacteraceae bacterium]|nr:haloacid dehalogenase-like hydrolase [Solirubrobacteraceae bacterium]